MKRFVMFMLGVFCIGKTLAQSFINGDDTVCPNSTLTYSVGGSLGGCGSKKYTVVGGVFPNNSNATQVTTNNNSIVVKWGTSPGSISAQGLEGACTSYVASKNVQKPSVPNVYTVEAIPALPSNSTSNFDIYVLVEDPSGISISSAPNGPQSFSLPSGFEVVSVVTAGTGSEFGVDYVRWKATIHPTSNCGSGTGTVKNYFNCGSGGEIYTTAKSFTINRAGPGVPTITTSNPLIRCNTDAGTVSCTSVSGADYYEWETSGGVSITAGNGTTSATVSGTTSGLIRVRAKNNGCGSAGNWSSWFNFHYGVPNIAASMTGTCSGYSLFLNDFAATSYNWYENSATSGNGYLSAYGNNASAAPTGGEYIVIGEAHNACGQAGYTFIMYDCNGYRIAPNPAKGKINIVFEHVDDIKTLPVQIDLLSEKSTNSLKSVDIKQVFNSKNFANGNTIVIDAEGLPKGIYYLHMKFDEQSKRNNKTDKIRVVLE